MKRDNGILSSIVILGSVLALFAPALIRPDGLIVPARGSFTDLTITHWPAFQYLRDSLDQTGALPLWRTSILGGTPFAADPVSGLWYPPNWLSIVLPLEWFFKIIVVAHLFAGGWAMMRLARSFGAGGVAATVAGVAYAIAPPAVGHAGAGHITLIEAWAWMPVVVWALRRAAAWRGILASGAALGLCALADVRMVVYAGIMAVLYSLFAPDPPAVLVARHSSRDRVMSDGARRIVRIVVLLIVAAVVSAATWLPALSLAAESTRVSLSPEDARRYSLGLDSLAGLLIAGRGNPEGITFVGLTVLTLSLIGLHRLWREQRGPALWLTALIVVGALAGLGANMPLYEWVARLPGLSLLRVPARAWFLAALAFPLAAGFGVEVLMRQPAERGLSKKWMLAGWIVGWFALLFGAGGAGVIFASADTFARVGLSLIGLALFLPLAIGLEILRARNRLSSTKFAVAMLVTVALDLMWAGWGHYRVVSKAEAFADGQTAAEWSASKGASYGRVYSPSYSLPQHVAQALELRLADGIDPMQLARTVRFMQAATGVGEWGYSVTLPAFEGLEDDADIRTWLKDAVPDPKLLGLLGVQFVAAHFPIAHPDLIEAARIEGARVYENQRVMPHAWVVGHVEVANDQAQAMAWLASHDPGEAAVVEGGSALDVNAIGEARIDVYQPDRIVVSARGPGLLILSEVFERDWRASIDGRPAIIVPTDGVLRGVYLPDGEHRVEFVYDPVVVKAGVALSGIGLAGVLVGWWVARRRR